MSPRAPESFPPLTPSMLHILLALGEGPLHGYGIMQAVDARTRGQVKLGPGNLYGSIRRLLEDGLIRRIGGGARVDARRIRYELTELGRKAVGLESARLRELVRWAEDGKLLKPARARGSRS